MKPKREIIPGKITPYTSWLRNQIPETLSKIELEDYISQKQGSVFRFHGVIANIEADISRAKAALSRKKSLQIVKGE